jgi:hypothetical protein
VTWLKENSIMENVSKLSAHTAIVAAATDLMIFLAKHQQLDKDLTKKLWEASLGKHESVKHGIFKALMDLFPHVSQESIEDFFNTCIKNVPLTEMDPETIEFVTKLTLLGMSRQSTVVFLAFEKAHFYF